MRLSQEHWIPLQSGSGDIMIDDFHLVSQEPYENLCWAACAEMILTHLQRPISRDEIVRLVKRRFTDETEWPQVAYERLGVDFRYAEPDVVTPKKIREWIVANSPLQPYIQWTGTPLYHVLIISGMFADGRLRLWDPRYNESTINTSEDLMTGYQEGVLAGMWYDMVIK